MQEKHCQLEFSGAGQPSEHKTLMNYINLFSSFSLRSTARVILRRVVLQVEETSAYCTVNDRGSASNYQLSNMKHPARDSNRRPQSLEARTLTTTPPSPLMNYIKPMTIDG